MRQGSAEVFRKGGLIVQEKPVGTRCQSVDFAESWL